jgi:hypothetical protein
MKPGGEGGPADEGQKRLSHRSAGGREEAVVDFKLKER